VNERERAKLRDEIARERIRREGGSARLGKSYHKPSHYGPRCPRILSELSKRAGEPCGAPAKYDGYCGTHKHFNQLGSPG